jgi:hypothetical protein
VVACALAVGLLAAAAGFAVRDSDSSARMSGSPRSSMASIPERLTDVGGIYQKDSGIELSDLDPSELPYPYITPVPPEVASPLDGVYVRVTPLEGLGQPAVALPIRCLRCIPFRVEAGVSTLTLYHGRYFLHHQLSGFRSLGFFEVDGHRVEFLDDPNCPTDRGVYRWQRDGVALSLRVVRDPCPFDQLRSQDLTASSWTLFNHCLTRFIGLWPGELGCSQRRFEP